VEAVVGALAALHKEGALVITFILFLFIILPSYFMPFLRLIDT
jgi:hypothetical protein